MPNKKENKLVLYKDDEGKLSINTLFADEDVWLTQAQLVESYKSSKSNISEHLKNIFNDNELDKEVVVRKFRTTTQHGAIEGKTQTHEVLHHARGQVPGRTLFADEDVWLTQAQLAEIYQTTQQNVSLHLQGIYEDKELDDESTHKKFLLVRQEGKRQVDMPVTMFASANIVTGRTL